MRDIKCVFTAKKKIVTKQCNFAFFHSRACGSQLLVFDAQFHLTTFHSEIIFWHQHVLQICSNVFYVFWWLWALMSVTETTDGCISVLVLGPTWNNRLVYWPAWACSSVPSRARVLNTRPRYQGVEMVTWFFRSHQRALFPRKRCGCGMAKVTGRKNMCKW